MQNWDSIYKTGIQSNNRSFPEQFLVKFFYDAQFLDAMVDSKLNILDVGSGYGRNIPLFQKFSSNITCIDPAETAINYIKQNYKVDAFLYNPKDLHIGSKYDVIVACNSIYYAESEHDFEKQLTGLVKLLRESGIFILSMVGRGHGILSGAKETSKNIVEISSNNENFQRRSGLKLYLKPDDFDFKKYGLNVLSQGLVYDNFDGVIRHLDVYMCKKLS